MIERERKFKLKGDIPKGAANTIQQGYLMLEGNKQLRVRITQGRRGQLCYKNSLDKTDREEYEFDIPLEDADALYATCEYKIIKFRKSFEEGPYHIDIDTYQNGLTIVEVEFEENMGYIPSYCGEEITGVKEYSNIYLAKTLI